VTHDASCTAGAAAMVVVWCSGNECGLKPQLAAAVPQQLYPERQLDPGNRPEFRPLSDGRRRISLPWAGSSSAGIARERDNFAHGRGDRVIA
jgi:hypothetical protein